MENMNEQPNLREFLNEVSSFQEEAPSAEPKATAPAMAAIGKVVEIAGSGSQIVLDAATVASLQSHKDPSVAMSGQVGSQVKTVVGNAWLIANVRTLRAGNPGELIAYVDFLGEGTRDSGGRIDHVPHGGGDLGPRFLADHLSPFGQLRQYVAYIHALRGRTTRRDRVGGVARL